MTECVCVCLLAVTHHQGYVVVDWGRGFMAT